MALGWEGRQVRLVPLERRKHFENCVRWLNDPLVTAWTLIGDLPLTHLAEEQYFARVEAQDGLQAPGELGFAIETLEEEHIGICGLHEIDFRHGSARTGTLIGRTQLWGRGYGTDAIAVRTRYAFDVLGLRLLLSEAFAENIGSLRALEKNGYRQVGRIPQRMWKRGAYRDLVLLALHREDWRTSRTPV